jgi:hypothetical protein
MYFVELVLLTKQFLLIIIFKINKYFQLFVYPGKKMLLTNIIKANRWVFLISHQLELILKNYIN